MGEIEIGKELAAQLATWDRRILEVAAIKKDEQDSDTLNLICSFEPDLPPNSWFSRTLCEKGEKPTKCDLLGICDSKNSIPSKASRSPRLLNRIQARFSSRQPVQVNLRYARTVKPHLKKDIARISENHRRYLAPIH